MTAEVVIRQLRVRFNPPNAGGFQHGEIVGEVPPEWHRPDFRSYLVLAPERKKGEGRRIKGWGHDIEKHLWGFNEVGLNFKLKETESSGGFFFPRSRYEVIPGEEAILAILANQPQVEATTEDLNALAGALANRPSRSPPPPPPPPPPDRDQLEKQAAKERAAAIEETGYDPRSPAAIAERQARMAAAAASQKAREARRATQRSSSQARRIERAVERAGDAEPIDACVETVFRPDERDRENLKWIGDVSGWPEWLDAREVRITPQYTGGGGHGLDLHAPGLRYDRAPMLRVNGVWCWFVPIGGRPGHHMGMCDTVDLPEIREYGEDLAAADLELPNEPIPPRTQTAVRKMHRLLQPPGDKYGAGMDAEMYRPWMADVRAIERAVMGISQAQGQADIYREMDDRDLTTALRLRDCIDCRYRRRPPAYRDYTLDDWMAELNDPKLNGWRGRIKACKKAARRSGERADSIQESIENLRAQYDAAIGRCVEREEEYADLIQVLYPA